jgi:hypothetical protein
MGKRPDIESVHGIVDKTSSWESQRGREPTWSGLDFRFNCQYSRFRLKEIIGPMFQNPEIKLKNLKIKNMSRPVFFNRADVQEVK